MSGADTVPLTRRRALGLLAASGAAAIVMRAACTLGTRPCSAMATSVELSTALAAASGLRPVSSR